MCTVPTEDLELVSVAIGALFMLRYKFLSEVIDALFPKLVEESGLPVI